MSESRAWTLAEIERLWTEAAEPGEAAMYLSVEWLVVHVKALRDLVAEVVEVSGLEPEQQALMREAGWEG